MYYLNEIQICCCIGVSAHVWFTWGEKSRMISFLSKACIICTEESTCYGLVVDLITHLLELNLSMNVLFLALHN